jgi:glutaminyl-peptide cyclotransferase
VNRPRRILAVCLCALGLLACKSNSATEAKTPEKKSPHAKPIQEFQSVHQAQAKVEVSVSMHDSTAPKVDSKRAMQYVREVVNIGPRSLGSPGHKKVQDYIKSKLQGDQVEDDVFTANTPAGPFEGRNIIAKYPGKKDGIIVLASHYDTNYGFKNYVGANDGGSTTGLLLEFANHIRQQGQREGYTVWLVWFDAEEAIREWSEADSLYGSRHLSEKLQKDGTLKKIKAFILLDMIGDADLSVEEDMNSTLWLRQVIYQAASRYGNQSYFFQRQGGIVDDHIPFVEKGVPAVDLIDFEYGYANVYHHTPQDTLDKLSPRSLQIVGDTVLESIRLLDEK